MLQFVDIELQGDREVVMTCVEIDGTALQFAWPSLCDDLDVAYAAVSSKPLSLENVRRA